MFSSRRKACPVLKHNRVGEVLKGSKVHDFEYYGKKNYVLKWKFNLCYQNCVIIQKLLENALRFATAVVLIILPCSADFTRVDRPTILDV